MSTTTNGRRRFFGLVPSSIVTTMKTKPVSGFCFLFVFAAIMNAGSANARILTTLSGTQAHITNNVFEAQNTEVLCDDGSIIVFNYVQRMVIGGKVEMVLTEFIYDVGTYDLVLSGQCDGKNLYLTGTCECLTTNFKNTGFIKDIETVATVDIEATAQELFFTGQSPLMAAHNPIDFLWIRKRDKKNSSIL